MKSYDFELEINANGIGYATIEYHFFKLREVLKNGEPIGTYHVKLSDLSSLSSAVKRFKEALHGCEIGVADPSNTLNLEYPIYIIVKDVMVRDNFNDIMSDLDEKLKKTVHNGAIK